MAGVQKVDSKLRVNMRLSVIEGILAMPLCFVAMPGNFLLASLVTEAIGLEEAMYGVIASLPAWSNVIQLFALPLLARYMSTKVVCLLFSWIHLLAWLAVGLALPKIAADGPWHSPVLILFLFTVAAIAFAMVNVSWTSWVQEWLPKLSRGKYLGRRNLLLQIGTVGFLLLASWFLAHWKSDPVFAFQSVLFAGVALRAISIVLQQWILPTRSVPDERRASRWSQVALIMKNQPLMRFIGFGAAFGFTVNFMGPFFPIFFYKVLGMSVDEVGRLVIVSTIAGAVSMPAWGRFFDKHGCRPGIMVALAIWMVVGYGYFFATPERTWVLYGIWSIGGAACAGFLFGSFSMILKLIPPEAKTTAISFNLAATSLAAACAPVAGGVIFDWAERTFDNQLVVFHTMSAIHHTVTLGTVLLLIRVVEPKSSSLTQAIGAMRAMRQLGALLGVSFLGNYSFIKREGTDSSEEER